uniref:Probable molybdenum cofactor guanylyltransferase n=1 Tax=Schlesneria paludicola TaxID=360056 RepID=A0A7C2JYQ4_9PLAN
MHPGAIVLCGGRSTRMGRDKATLPFGPESLLQRVVRLLSTVVDAGDIVVVAAADQILPTLPVEVVVARDLQPERGPLEGLASGLAALPGRVDAVYATSCDVPLLEPAFVRRMFDLLGDSAIAVPRDGEYHHPLAAVYRPSVLTAVQQLLAEDRLRPRFLFDLVPTRDVSVDDLEDVDPERHTLMNLNRPEDYEAALRIAGL